MWGYGSSRWVGRWVFKLLVFHWLCLAFVLCAVHGTDPCHINPLLHLCVVCCGLVRLPNMLCCLHISHANPESAMKCYTTSPITWKGRQQVTWEKDGYLHTQQTSHVGVTCNIKAGICYLLQNLQKQLHSGQHCTLSCEPNVDVIVTIQHHQTACGHKV